MVGWHHWLNQWTWVWASSGRCWMTGRPGVLQSMGSQRVGHDWATEQQSQAPGITQELEPMQNQEFCPTKPSGSWCTNISKTRGLLLRQLLGCPWRQKKPLLIGLSKQPVHSSDLSSLFISLGFVCVCVWWPGDFHYASVLIKTLFCLHQVSCLLSGCGVSHESDSSPAICPHPQQSLPSSSTLRVCQEVEWFPYAGWVRGRLLGDAHKISASLSARGYLAH